MVEIAIRIPVIDLGTCTDCEGCLEVSPSVFQRNWVTGLIEVAELDSYPEKEVEEAIKYCPADSIQWEDR